MSLQLQAGAGLERQKHLCWRGQLLFLPLPLLWWKLGAATEKWPKSTVVPVAISNEEAALRAHKPAHYLPYHCTLVVKPRDEGAWDTEGTPTPLVGIWQFPCLE